jgi:hypothetical protein
VRSRARLGIPVLLIFAAGCAGGQDVTPRAVETARARWEKAGLRDYDLDWSVTGPNTAHYFVTVRQNQVRKVELVARDGTRVAVHPAEMHYYSADGLFRTIADELAQLKTDHPFGQRPGTKVVMRFQPDAQLGYPRWYRRDVMGTSLSISIDVNSLTAVAAPEPPGP